jgi:abhydrolase domain-containing protein 13
MLKKLLGIGAVSVGVGAVAAATALLYTMQEKLIYLPNHPSANDRSLENNPFMFRHPLERGIPCEDVYLKTSDKLILHGWLMRQRDPHAATIIFFQENAGNMGMRMDYLEVLFKQCGLNVFIVSYRGYGKSQGSPSEKGLMLDAEAGLTHLFSELRVDNSKVFLFGRSLGGAVAIFAASELAERFRVRGIIVENTFTSIDKVVDSLFPGMSLVRKALLRNHWPSGERIKTVRVPVMMVSGGKDELIPPAQMRELRQNASQAPFVEWKMVPEGGHNDTWEKAWEEYPGWVTNFVNQCLAPSL